MKIFISWAGERSLKVATIFREWLPSVLQCVEPYVSSEDIDKGARWSNDIAKELESSSFGILCVTKENIEAPWISFEAGALSKTLDKSYVTPFLFDIKRSEISGPILQFQSTIFEKEDIKRLVKTINKASLDNSLPDERVEKIFEVWYPILETNLKAIPEHIEGTSKNKAKKEQEFTHIVLEELLELTRDNQKILKTTDSNIYHELEEVKQRIEMVRAQSHNVIESKKKTRLTAVLFDEILYKANRQSLNCGFLIVLNSFKEDFPWLYDLGKELLDTLKKPILIKEKIEAANEYRALFDFSIEHPIVRETYLGSRKLTNIKENYYFLFRCLDDMIEKIRMDEGKNNA